MCHINAQLAWQQFDKAGIAATASGGRKSPRHIFLTGLVKEGFQNPLLGDEDKLPTQSRRSSDQVTTPAPIGSTQGEDPKFRVRVD